MRKSQRRTSSLARLARRRIERNRNTEIAPVRRTLVATWRLVGSSSVAKIEFDSGGSSTGPISSLGWARHLRPGRVKKEMGRLRGGEKEKEGI